MNKESLSKPTNVFTSSAHIGEQTLEWITLSNVAAYNQNRRVSITGMPWVLMNRDINAGKPVSLIIRTLLRTEQDKTLVEFMYVYLENFPEHAKELSKVLVDKCLASDLLAVMKEAHPLPTKECN